MTPTKLLIGQILIVFAIVIAGLWVSTQWAAAMLAYQPELGPAWFRMFDTPIYRPWAIFWWWYSYDAYAPHVFDKAGALAGASGFIGCGAAIAGSLWRARQSRNVTTYGSARWATTAEMDRAGLFGDAGVFLGRQRSRYLRHDGPEHVMAFAPTRSGKGVGLVVPTLLSWTGSTVVHDIKGENWQLTAGWRSRFTHALLFNPTDARSARYNPLLEVRRGEHEVRDVQNIADILVDPEGALERRNHWEKTSHSLLVGAILHILYAEEEKTLARVATFLSDPQRPFVATLKRMMTTNHLGTKDAPQVHPVVASAAREVLNKSENERSGVLSTAMSFLGLYRDPTVAAVTSRCDWRIAALLGFGAVGSLGAGLLTSGPAAAQLSVFDPSNYAQNLLTAARALQQVNNQIQSLQNEAQMLINQGKNLTRIDFPQLQQLQQRLQQIDQLMGQAQGIDFRVDQLDDKFRQLFPDSFPQALTRDQQIAAAKQRLDNEMAAFRQHHRAWCDELAAWRYPETWDQVQFGLRLGTNPQAVVTTTPKPTPLVRDLVKRAGTIITRGSTFDNAANLAPAALDGYRARYEGTRLGRQELHAELLLDTPGALWTLAMLDGHRREKWPDLQRVVVAVDPSGTKGDGKGDDIGIVAAGLGTDGRGYVLGDFTCQLSPEGWARRAVSAYHQLGADRLVAERNFGGAMVQAVIRSADENVSFKEVTASRGKVARAEPIAALYEQGKVSHVGSFPDLEDQMCNMTPAGYVGQGSPDRADALVWALTELMLGGSYKYDLAAFA